MPEKENEERILTHKYYINKYIPFHSDSCHENNGDGCRCFMNKRTFKPKNKGKK